MIYDLGTHRVQTVGDEFFVAPVREGHVEAVSRPLHKGRTTIVVETDLFDAAERRVARVTQTQAILS